MRADRMQQSRFELKYLISENTAERVRDFVRCYLAMDEYSVGRPNYSYPVTASTSTRIRWRFTGARSTATKTVSSCACAITAIIRHPRLLRDQAADEGRYFEAARRCPALSGVVAAQRASSGRQAHDYQGSGSLVAVQRFQYLMLELNAKPKSHIFYQREAYVADNDEVRVTLDRDVYSEPNLASTIKVKMTKPVLSYAGFVILELKFTNRFPNWFRELVRVAESMQCGAAKYVSGVGLLGHARLSLMPKCSKRRVCWRIIRPG